MYHENQSKEISFFLSQMEWQVLMAKARNQGLRLGFLYVDENPVTAPLSAASQGLPQQESWC